MSRIYCFRRCAATLPVLLLAAGPAFPQTSTPPPPLPVGPEIIAADDVQGASFDVFDDGGYVVVWGEPESPALHARLFGADDQPRSEAFEVGPVTAPPRFGYKGGWDVAALGGDGQAWALGWAQPACDGCPTAVFLSLYDGDRPILEAASVAAGHQDRYRPVLAAPGGGDGPFAIGWTADNEVPSPPVDGLNFSDVYARLYTVDGTPASPTFQVNEDEYDEQILVDATFLPSGDLVFLWESYEGEGYFWDVMARHFDAHGVPRGSESRVHDGQQFAQFGPAVTTTDFGYLVAWTDWSYTTDFDGAIVARPLAPNGAPLGPEFLVSPPDPAADRDFVSVAGSADGSLVALWSANCAPFDCTGVDRHGPDGSFGGIFGRSFAPLWWPNGGPDDDSGEFGVPLTTLGDQSFPVVRATSPTGFLALWLSRPPEGGPARVVLRRLEGDPCLDLCLGDGRFEVTVEWEDFGGHTGVGTAVPRGDDWGTFWFFRPANVELAVKVLDGSPINGHFWVFHAALSNVAYTLRVTDRFTGREYVHANPAGRFASGAATTALPVAKPPSAAPAAPVAPPLRRTGTAPAPSTLAPCSGDQLCLHGDRFAVEVEWRTPQGGSGHGVGAPLSGDAGWLWFFRPGNPELLVKVLDGRPVNGHFWVFHAALSNVAYTLRVTDRVTGTTATYDNPQGAFASRGDTVAFPAP